jgi:hypothetical protein
VRARRSLFTCFSRTGVLAVICVFLICSAISVKNGFQELMAFWRAGEWGGNVRNVRT